MLPSLYAEGQLFGWMKRPNGVVFSQEDPQKFSAGSADPKQPNAVRLTLQPQLSRQKSDGEGHKLSNALSEQKDAKQFAWMFYIYINFTLKEKNIFLKSERLVTHKLPEMLKESDVEKERPMASI